MKVIRTPLLFENGKIATVSDPNEIARQKIIDVLVTSPGERVMRPQYGSGVYDLLFEPADPLLLADFRAESMMDIQENVSGVSVNSLNIVSGASLYGDPTTLEVELTFTTPVGGTTTSSVLITDSETFDEGQFL